MFAFINLTVHLWFTLSTVNLMDAEGFTSIENQREACSWESSNENFTTHRALLASRIHSLEELKRIVKVDYFPKDTVDKTATKYVCLTYSSMGKEISAVLKEGIDQDEIVKAKDGSLLDKLSILFKDPFAIKIRDNLKRINILARRFRIKYGDEDLAFYDLGLASLKNIRKTEHSFTTALDSSENGYINTFNHVTAQALISSIFGIETAEFVAVVHERENMPELMDKNVISNLNNSDMINQAVDNYVDLLNNKMGQLLGSALSNKYNINRRTVWNEQLLSSYLNDVQEFYRYSFNISMKPFNEDDEIVIRFSRKLKAVL